MSENRIQKEPSTEEILGSIRRIITEDNAQAGTVGSADAASDSEAPTDDIAAAESEAAEATDRVEATEDDEVLELTDEVADDDAGEAAQPDEAGPDVADETEDTRREPRFGLSATPSYDSGAEEGEDARREPVIGIQSSEAPGDEPPSSTDPAPGEEFAAPLQGYNYSPQVLSSTQDAAEQEDDAMESTAPEEPEAPESADQIEPDQPAAEDSGPSDDIVSATATAATAAALGDLNRAVSEKTGKLKLGGETTVADIVKEMLRPMLREWLDENLPLIVDRVVRREIQKLVDRAQDDD